MSKKDWFRMDLRVYSLEPFFPMKNAGGNVSLDCFSSVSANYHIIRQRIVYVEVNWNGQNKNHHTACHSGGCGRCGCGGGLRPGCELSSQRQRKHRLSVTGRTGLRRHDGHDERLLLVWFKPERRRLWFQSGHVWQLVSWRPATCFFSCLFRGRRRVAAQYALADFGFAGFPRG